MRALVLAKALQISCSHSSIRHQIAIMIIEPGHMKWRPLHTNQRGVGKPFAPRIWPRNHLRTKHTVKNWAEVLKTSLPIQLNVMGSMIDAFTDSHLIHIFTAMIMILSLQQLVWQITDTCSSNLHSQMQKIYMSTIWANFLEVNLILWTKQFVRGMQLNKNTSLKPLTFILWIAFCELLPTERHWKAPRLVWVSSYDGVLY